MPDSRPRYRSAMRRRISVVSFERRDGEVKKLTLFSPVAIFCSLCSSNSLRTSFGTSFLSASLNFQRSSLCSWKEKGRKRGGETLARHCFSSHQTFFRRVSSPWISDGLFSSIFECFAWGASRFSVSIELVVFSPLRFRLELNVIRSIWAPSQFMSISVTSRKPSMYQRSSSGQFDLLCSDRQNQWI